MPTFSVPIRPGWRGAFFNQSPLGAVPETLISGLNVIPVGPGKIRGFPGYGSVSNTAGAVAMPVKDTSGVIGSGSITYIGRTNNDIYLWCGGGTAIVGTTVLGAATSALQFKIGLGGAAITAGVATPSQPTLAVNGPGNMTGTYSVKIAWKRSATGAVGNASQASPSVAASSNALKLTGPVPPTGIDRVRVYACARGFSTTGPWLFLSEHSCTAGVALNITALGPNGNGQWADGDRGSELAPIENFSPSDLGVVATHCCSLGSVMVILGPGGYYFSFPGKFETYSPDRYGGLPGSVVGISPRAADGIVYLWGTNWLGALILTPDAEVIPRIAWPHVGGASANSFCLVESELWGYTNEPVRTTQAGDPDTSFGLAWRDYMRENWTPANVVVSYSPEYNAVVYYHGSEALAYFRALDAWSTRLTGITGARSAVTVGNRGLVSGSGATMSAFGGGSGSSWSAQVAWEEGPAPGLPMTLTGVRTVTTGAGVQIDVLTNFSTTPVATQVVLGSGSHFGTWLSLHQPNVDTFSLQYSGVGLQEVNLSHVEGISHRVRLTG